MIEEKNLQLKLQVYDSAVCDNTKSVIVLIHGNSSSKEVFQEQIKYFSETYRVIAIDLLGHGKSTKISNLENINGEEREQLAEVFYNPCAMISEITQLLQAKKIENSHLIGWSLGGHIGYGVAIENQKLVSSITTIGSPPVLFSANGFKKGFGEWFVTTLVPDWVNNPKNYSREEASVISASIGFKSEDKFAIEDLMNTDPLIRRHLFLKLNEYDKETYRAVLDAENFILNTDLPVCLIVGEKDAGINASYINNFERKLKNQDSSVHVIQDAPHAVFSTNKNEYLKIVDNFIEEVSPSNSLIL